MGERPGVALSIYRNDQRPGAGNRGSKYTSNKTHYSPTDPDARIIVKPGKARKLNYMSQLSVDKAHHVIVDFPFFREAYRSTKQCKGCPIARQCLGKTAKRRNF